MGLWGLPGVAHAYIGPGAGFAVISSFFMLFLTAIVAFLALLVWPFRQVRLMLKRRSIKKHRKAPRVVVLGLDGLDPALTARYMRKGLLPHFSRLKQQGSFRPLMTTTPSISPVAWSTFSTGVNPGKHRIFDFYTRDPNNYLPVLSSVKISTRKERLKIGPIRLPLNRTHVKLLRSSISFWKILGRYGVFSSILRVPITFPPDKFYGHCLAGMCVPDLRGTQGAFTCFTTEPAPALEAAGVDGAYVTININENRFVTELPGPVLPGKDSRRPLSMTIRGKVDRERETVTLNVGDSTVTLQRGEYSSWIKLPFKVGVRKRIWGVARFMVTEMQPHLKLYVTPINLDPEHPALPISHPFYYAVYLSKLGGDFSTLGLAEDTWALNERVIDEKAFLQQAYDIYAERETHFMAALEKNRSGLVVGVFDTPDRIQHMFFRYLDHDHPANKGKDVTQFKDAITDLYVKMDTLVGRVIDQLNPNDVLMVVSDHGFKPFKWGVNLNTWLWREGYLVLKDEVPADAPWFQNVDWDRTRAFAYGLTGIFLNLKGRERQGIVDPGKEHLALQLEIKQKLEAYVDEARQQNPIRRCMLAQMTLKGPYVKEAPDLLIGYRVGYRASWNSAVGKITDRVIEPNTKSWSGDHAIDPRLVPGIFFSNWSVKERRPALADLGPTILALFGLKKAGLS